MRIPNKCLSLFFDASGQQTVKSEIADGGRPTGKEKIRRTSTPSYSVVKSRLRVIHNQDVAKILITFARRNDLRKEQPTDK